MEKPLRNHNYEKNPRWKDGRKAYKKMAFERYKMKKQCSVCKTKDKLVIHHKDENRYNNSKENLQVMCVSCHLSYHHKGVPHKPTFTKHHTEKSKKLISIATSGKNNGFYGKKWEDYGGHPKGMLGKKHTKKTLKKISEVSKQMWINWRLAHNKQKI